MMLHCLKIFLIQIVLLSSIDSLSLDVPEGKTKLKRLFLLFINGKITAENLSSCSRHHHRVFGASKTGWILTIKPQFAFPIAKCFDQVYFLLTGSTNETLNTTGCATRLNVLITRNQSSKALRV